MLLYYKYKDELYKYEEIKIHLWLMIVLVL